MFCSHCGTPLAENVSFCPICGTPVARQPEPPVSQAIPAQPTEPVFVQPAPVIPVTEPVPTPMPEPIPEPAPAPMAFAPEAQPMPEPQQPVYQPVEQPVYQPIEQPAPTEPQFAPAQPTDFQPNYQPSAAPTVVLSETDGNTFVPPTGPADPAYGYNQPYGQPYGYAPAYAPKPKKPKMPRKKLIKRILFVTVPALIVAAAIAFNFGWIKAFFIRTFGSNESYLRLVETKSLKSSAHAVTNYYEKLEDLYGEDGMSSDIKMSFEISKKGKQVLEDLGMEDVKWIDGLTFTGSSSFKDNRLSGESAIQLDGSTLLSLVAAADLKDGMSYYFAVPELADKYLRLNLADFAENQSEFTAATSALQNLDLEDLLPDKDVIDDLADRYIDAALKDIADVTKEKETVTAAGVSQKCTVLKLDFNQKTLAKMLRNIAQTAKNDSQIKDLIYDYVDELKDFQKSGDFGLSLDADSVYEQFQELCDEAVKQCDENDDLDSDTLLTLIDYIDGDEIVGRTLLDEDGDPLFKYAFTHDGKSFGFECVLEDGDDFSISGKGTEKSGKLTGDLSVSIDGEPALILRLTDWDMVALSKGYPVGKIAVFTDGELKDDLADELDDMDIDLDDPGIEIGFDTAEKSCKISLSVLDGKDPLLTANYAATFSDGKKVTLPKKNDVMDAEDEDGILDWVDSWDTEKFISKLRKTDLPDEWVDAIEDALNNVMSEIDYYDGYESYDDEDDYYTDDYYGYDEDEDYYDELY